MQDKGEKEGLYPGGAVSSLQHSWPLLNFSPAVWAWPERTLSWLGLSKMLSMLGDNILLATCFDLSGNMCTFCVSVKSKVS